MLSSFAMVLLLCYYSFMHESMLLQELLNLSHGDILLPLEYDCVFFCITIGLCSAYSMLASQYDSLLRKSTEDVFRVVGTEGIILATEEERIFNINASMLRLCGYDDIETSNKNAIGLLDSDISGWSICTDGIETEQVLVTRDGSSLVVLVTRTKQHCPTMADGSVFIVYAVRDKKDCDRIPRIDETEADRKHMSTKQFIMASISHELRTPLNAVIGALYEINTKLKPGNLLQTSNLALYSAEYLLLIIDDLMDFSRFESGIVLAKEPFCLRQVAHDAAKFVTCLADEKGLDVDVFADSECDGLFIGDARRLKQLLVNLLANAVKFTRVGFVYLGVRVVHDVVEFVVRDTGCGMTREQKRLFENFSNKCSGDQGNGLGYRIVSRIIQLSGSGIEILDGNVRGTLIRIHMKLDQVSEDQADRRFFGSQNALPKPLIRVSPGCRRSSLQVFNSLSQGETVRRQSSESLLTIAEGQGNSKEKTSVIRCALFCLDHEILSRFEASLRRSSILVSSFAKVTPSFCPHDYEIIIYNDATPVVENHGEPAGMADPAGKRSQLLLQLSKLREEREQEALLPLVVAFCRRQSAPELQIFFDVLFVKPLTETACAHLLSVIDQYAIDPSSSRIRTLSLMSNDPDVHYVTGSTDSVILLGSADSDGGSGAYAVTSDNAATGPDMETSNDSTGDIVPILVVEDNSVSARLIKVVIEKLGLTCEVACNGKEAVEKWQAGQYSLIFMDCQMPVMDGYEATKEIRRLEKELGRPHVFISALTAAVFEGDHDFCREIGMDGFLQKPCRMDSLYPTIKEALGLQ